MDEFPLLFTGINVYDAETPRLLVTVVEEMFSFEQLVHIETSVANTFARPWIMVVNEKVLSFVRITVSWSFRYCYVSNDGSKHTPDSTGPEDYQKQKEPLINAGWINTRDCSC